MHHSTSLNWVKPGVDEGLAQIRQVLGDLAEGPAPTERAAGYERARELLHRLRLTFELLEVYGASLLAEEMEGLAAGLARNLVDQQDDGLRLLMQGTLHLPHYLERVQTSGRDIPVLMMPLLNDMRALLGRQLLSATSLFSPDLECPIPDLPPSLVATGAVRPEAVTLYARKLRLYFQRALVSWYRGRDEAAALKTLASVLTHLERLAGGSALWWIAGGLAAALREGSLAGSVSAKLLMGQLDREIRHLVVDGAEALERQAPRDLLKNLLFYVGEAHSSHPRVTAIQRHYRLAELLPSNQDDGTGLGPDLQALSNVSDALLETLAQVKDVLDIYVRQQEEDPARLEPALALLERIADTLALLGLGVARRKVRGQLEALTGVVAGGQAADETLLAHVAESLIEVDDALSTLTSAGLADAVADPASPDPGDAPASYPDRPLFDAANGEVRAELAAVREEVSAHLHAPAAGPPLDRVDDQFRRILGGLTMLGLGAAAEMASSLRRYVRERLAPAAPALPPERELQAFADGVVGLEFYLEAMAERRSDAASLLAGPQRAVTALGLGPELGVEESEQDLEEVQLAPPSPERAEEETATALAVSEYLEEDAEEITLSPLPDPGVEALPVALMDSLQRARARLQRMEGDVETAPEATAPAPPRGDGATAAAEGEARVPAADVPGASGESPTGPGTAGESAASAVDGLGAAVATDALDPEIVTIFLEEAGELGADIGAQLSRWTAQPGDPAPLAGLRRSFHTLKGSGRLVGAHVIADLAWAVERLLNRLVDGTLAYHPAMAELVADTLNALPALVEDFRDARAPRCDPAPIMERAAALTQGPVPSGDGEQRGGGGGGPSGGDGPGPGGIVGGGGAGRGDGGIPSTAAPAPDAASQLESSSGTADPNQRDPGMLEVFRGEAQGCLADLRGYGSTLTAVGGTVPAELVRLCHTLKGITRLAGLASLANLFASLEASLAAARRVGSEISATRWTVLEGAAEALAAGIDAVTRGHAVNADGVETLEAAARDLALVAVPPAPPPGPPTPEPAASLEPPEDDLVVELREVFVDEADALLREADELVERWGRDPGSGLPPAELHRQLHTLKGGARMAEAGAIADLAHALEGLLRRFHGGTPSLSRTARALLQEALDRLATMVDELRVGREPAPAADLISRLEESALRGSEVPLVAPVAALEAPLSAPLAQPPGPVPEPSGSETPPVPASSDPARHRDGIGPEGTPKVTVRSELLDLLVDHAGEISIARTRVEEQVGSVRYSLEEMERTVQRLREQIRGLEMETEARIASGWGAAPEAGDPPFDPLEMDRFTQVQQLSRSVMESVTDLDSIRVQLTDLTRDSETILLEQARLSRELQKHLMTTRLVPFARYLPRLRRVVRQTAAAVDKPVELSVHGQGAEVDHGVLERIVPALEHVLRNAVDHGLEPPVERHQAGKPATGHLRLACFRDGAEVVIEVGDDGRGFDLAAIRRQAEDRGLLSPGTDIADAELVQFVFEQSFSTAAQVTQISGRGVGLDVVNGAVGQLGGSLQLDTQAGGGTTVRMRLPTSLALTQALLVHLGEDLLAIPLTNVEGVVRMLREQAEALAGQDNPQFEQLGQRYRLVHLSRLLGVQENPALPPHSRFPVLLTRSGDRRVGFLVDGVSGRQEVVVKPVGTQVGSVRWVNGATILGDGRVVLVADLPALVRLAAGRPDAAEATPAGADPMRAPVVMVVDDSVTVRRVTERFLVRHGMDVVLAKDGVEALTLLQERSADVLLLDVEMPRMDGFELATTVRNDTRLRSLPIIMVTSRTGVKHMTRARTIGVDRYLGKPYHEEELLRNIRALLVRDHG